MDFSKIRSAGAELIYSDRERERERKRERELELERQSDRRIGTAKINGDLFEYAKRFCHTNKVYKLLWPILYRLKYFIM